MECLAFLLSVDLLIFWFIIQSVDLKFWYANIKFYSVDLACCWFNFFKLRLGALRPRSVGQSVGLLVGPPKITKKMTKLYKTFQTIKEELLWQKTTFDRRRPLIEDNLWQKTTFDKRRPLMEDDLWRKTTFDGKWPLTEDNLLWRWPLIEDDLWWKMTFDARQTLMQDNFCGKTTFDGTLLIDDDLW